MAKVSDGTATVGVLRLVSTAPDGFGPFTPHPGKAFGIAEIPLAGVTGEAVFEVMNADPFYVERADVPVYVAFHHAHPGTADVAGTFAPISATPLSSTSAPVPRFANTGVPQTAFVLPNPCH